MRRPMVMRSRATDGRSASKCLRKHPKQPSRLPGRDRIRPRRSSVLLEGRKSANIYAGSGFIRGIPVKRLIRHIGSINPGRMPCAEAP